MMAAGDWPRAKKTTTVAPSRPASVNSCQGWSDSGRSVEVSELIVQAGVQRGVRRGADSARHRGRTMGPAPGVHHDDDEANTSERVRQQPREAVERRILGDFAHMLPVLGDKR